MPMKISFMRSSTWYMGCWRPSFASVPGMVTSSASPASLSSSAFSLMRFFCIARCSSTAARTSLASCPMAGRSSAESRPICLSTTVSSPFFPRYCTRSASSASALSAPVMALRDRSRSSFKSSFMR